MAGRRKGGDWGENNKKCCGFFFLYSCLSRVFVLKLMWKFFCHIFSPSDFLDIQSHGAATVWGGKKNRFSDFLVSTLFIILSSQIESKFSDTFVFLPVFAHQNKSGFYFLWFSSSGFQGRQRERAQLRGKNEARSLIPSTWLFVLNFVLNLSCEQLSFVILLCFLFVCFLVSKDVKTVECQLESLESFISFISCLSRNFAINSTCQFFVFISMIWFSKQLNRNTETQSMFFLLLLLL